MDQIETNRGNDKCMEKYANQAGNYFLDMNYLLDYLLMFWRKHKISTHKKKDGAFHDSFFSYVTDELLSTILKL